MPITLPAHIAARYRPATDNEIRAESYGLLKAARLNAEAEWRKQRGSFDDQTTFGPKRDFECACGKYAGREYERFICDQCGVKVTTSDSRRKRCAHINLPVPIVHPLGIGHEPLSVVPVLPVAFVEAPRGAELILTYEKVLLGNDADGIAAGFGRLLDVLAPLLIAAHDWDLAERTLIAHGMALKERGA